MSLTAEQLGDLAYMLEHSDAWQAVLQMITDREEKLKTKLLSGACTDAEYHRGCGELASLQYVAGLPAQMQRSAKYAAETPDNP